MTEEHQVSAEEAVRETSAERMERTRVRLLDAVFESLSECGYAGTTTSEVARRSGLTRGAQLHHFGTKDQMMVAAAQHMNTRANAAFVAAALDELPDDQDRIRAALEVLARVYTGRRPAAYIELWVASRTHPELVPALREADVVGRDDIRALFGDEILERATPEFDALIDFIHFALRGIALDAHLATDAQRQKRTELILGEARYLEDALLAPH